MIEKVTSLFADMWLSLSTNWGLKLILSFFSWITIELFSIKHVQVFGFFILLVIIDLITKWASISYQMLIEKGATKVHMYEKYLGIIIAFEEKRIGSIYMKKGMFDKLITYGVATFMAYTADNIITLSGYPAFMLNMAWLYFCGSEVLSILENMRDGGNTTMGRFLDIIKEQIHKRLGIKM